VGKPRRTTSETWGDVLVKLGFDSIAASNLVGMADLHMRRLEDRSSLSAERAAISVALVRVALELNPELREVYQPGQDSVAEAVRLLKEVRPETTMAEIGLLFGSRSDATLRKWASKGWSRLPIGSTRIGALIRRTLEGVGEQKQREAIESMLAAAAAARVGA